MFSNKKLLLKVLFFVLCFYALTFTLSRIFNIGISDIRNFVEQFGIFGPIVYSFVLLLGLTIPFNPISDFLVVNVAAILFPFYVSIVFTFIVHSLAISINYYIGLKYGDRIIRKLTNEKNEQLVHRITKKITLRNIFILRLFLPTSNFVGVEIVSYASGIEKIPFFKFYLVSIIPWTTISIIYFLSTSFLRDRAMSLYFLPAIILVGLPLIILFIVRRLNHNS